MESYVVAIVVLGLMAVTVLGAVLQGKKKEQANDCSACPNYSTCRAHLGCSNHPKYRKQEKTPDQS